MKLIVPLILAVSLVISGCVSGFSPESIVKSSPQVQSFLQEHPNAVIKVIHLSEDQVKKNIDTIRELCGNEMEIKEYYKVTITEGNSIIIAYVDPINQQTDGMYIYSTASTATPTATSITQPTVPIVSETSTPVATTPILSIETANHGNKDCDFCHPQEGYVPKCSDCHGLYHSSGFEECSQCHVNAHEPLDIKFSTEISNEKCSFCHSQVIRTTFEAHPTKHAELDCVLCHQKHGQIPECTMCHTGHDETMTSVDCSQCHLQGHIPTNIDYQVIVPSTFCAACHEENARLLKENITGHSNKNCAYCHSQHGKILLCTTCHGSKHDMSSGCTTCHISSHNLSYPE